MEAVGYQNFGFRDAGRMVSLTLHPTNHEMVELHSVIAYPDRVGQGTAIMKRLCELADQLEVILWLEALPYGSDREHIPHAKLTAWYKSFQFFHIKYPNPKWLSPLHIKEKSNWLCPMMRNPKW